MTEYRIERDPLGELQVPAAAYYGVQTARAVENFPISGLRAAADLVTATILIKKAAAEANAQLGRLDRDVANAIVRAADEILDGRLRDQFVVDVYQAGAGTSHNMNANEVLANRAGELLGAARRRRGAGATHTPPTQEKSKKERTRPQGFSPPGPPVGPCCSARSRSSP